LKTLLLAASLVLAASGTAFADVPLNKKRVHLAVVATAYNSTHTQTDGDPRIGAWGDRLDRVEGARVIAVSRDLLKKGLSRGQRVRIHGYAGEFVVLDKMPKRWKKHIDIFMDKDIRGARRFGRRHVRISWVPDSLPVAAQKKDGAGMRQPRRGKQTP
jgi:3D (Asp-Asp-Asp) domain-containing protein